MFLFYINIFNFFNLAGIEIIIVQGIDFIYVEYEFIWEGGQEDIIVFGGINFFDLVFFYMEGYFGIEV